MTLTYQDGFAVPSDVPLYVPQPIVFPSGATPHIVGDGTGTRGSAMPLLSTQPADIPSTATGWLVAGDVPITVTNPATEEAKFRLHFNESHILPDDPIRAFGQPGASHMHHFFGNTTTNAFSTFATLRNRANALAARSKPASTAAGGPYNATGYWMPAMLKGNYAVKPGMIFGYYTSNPASRSLVAQRIPRGFRYVSGFNMDDPTNSAILAQRDAANAAHLAATGVSGRYQFAGTGVAGWSMLTPDANTVIQTTLGSDFSPYIVNPNGSDPWGGAATAGCWLKNFIDGARFIDGVNLWSPGGYVHTHPGLRDTVDGNIYGPQGWYGIPQLQIVPFWQHQGWADYSTWQLSSDAHAAAMLGTSLIRGASFHLDWFGGWDDSVFGGSNGWQIQCLAAADGATMRECASGTFKSDGTRLLGSIDGDSAPDGSRVPQINFFQAFNTGVPADMRYIPPGGFAGNVTVPCRAA